MASEETLKAHTEVGIDRGGLQLNRHGVAWERWAVVRLDAQRRRARQSRESDTHVVRRKITVPFVPPNPKELDMAMSIFISRAVWGT